MSYLSLQCSRGKEKINKNTQFMTAYRNILLVNKTLDQRIKYFKSAKCLSFLGRIL